MSVGADGGTAEVLQAASEVDLLVVVLQGGCSGHGLGAVLVLVLIGGPVKWRRLRAPRQFLENLLRFGVINRRTFGQNLLRVQLQVHAAGRR